LRAETNKVVVDGVELGYDVYGSCRDTVVLRPALLMSRRMQEPLARSLAARRIRTVCLDYLGDRVDGAEQQPWHFSSERLGAQTLAVLDALGIERAVIGGTSIGSNIALEAALADPDRFTGLLLEGPFLDHAAFATAFAWSAMFALVRLGRPVLRFTSFDPARATAFLQGLMFGRVGVPVELRSTVQVPALVIGFPLDPFHPISDALALSEQLPSARLVRTSSIADLRVRPELLAGEIARFVGDCRRAAAPDLKEAVA